MSSSRSLWLIYILTVYVLLFFPLIIQAQISVSDIEKLLLTSNESPIYSYYDSLFQSELQIIDGRLHSDRYPSGTGHPFYLSRESVPGTILYEGRVYKYSFIRYDILNDILQIHHFSRTGSYIIDLNTQKINAFRLNGHTFIRLSSSISSGSRIEDGFYELVYNGETKYWLKWEKNFVNRTVESAGEFETVKTRYLSRDGNWYRITNRFSLLKAFSDKKDEVRDYLKTARISVRVATDDELKTVLKHCDSL